MAEVFNPSGVFQPEGTAAKKESGVPRPVNYTRSSVALGESSNILSNPSNSVKVSDVATSTKTPALPKTDVDSKPQVYTPPSPVKQPEIEPKPQVYTPIPQQVKKQQVAEPSNVDNKSHVVPPVPEPTGIISGLKTPTPETVATSTTTQPPSAKQWESSVQTGPPPTQDQLLRRSMSQKALFESGANVTRQPYQPNQRGLSRFVNNYESKDKSKLIDLVESATSFWLVLILSLIIIVWLVLYLAMIFGQMFMEVDVKLPAEMLSDLSNLVVFLSGSIAAKVLGEDAK